MITTKHLQLRVTRDRYIPVDISMPDGDWFTDAHLQEIIVALGQSFKEIYNLSAPRVYRTPRCSFSVYSASKSFRSYIFLPEEEQTAFSALASYPKTFYVRVLGRADVAEKLLRQTTLDSAFRIVKG